jgi:hypothetical protein
LNEVSEEYYMKILVLAKKYNITIILVKFPHSIEYQEAIEVHGLDTEEYYDALFERINRTTDGKYHVLDYYSLFFGKPQYLKDPDHVNYKGSEILSKKFYTDVKSLGEEDTKK